MSAWNRTAQLAIVFVSLLLVLALCGAGVMLQVQSARQDAVEAGAVIDGIQTFPPTGKQIYGGEANLWRLMFREPFETVVFLFRDGSLVTFSTHDEAIIDAPISLLVEHLKKTGRSLEDCLAVAHNHFTPVGFTRGDEYVYSYLKGRGFRGVFGIYYTATGRFLGIQDN